MSDNDGINGLSTTIIDISERNLPLEEQKKLKLRTLCIWVKTKKWYDLHWKISANFLEVFKIFSSIVQLKKLIWLISSSYKKKKQTKQKNTKEHNKKLSSGASKVNETLSVVFYVVHNEEKSER